ncbi:MAG: hypothetical protein ACLRMX_14415 [Lachnospira eligens]
MFRRKYAYHTFDMPDFDAMRKAAGYFEGRHDLKHLQQLRRARVQKEQLRE